MQRNERHFRRGHLLVRMGDRHDTIYRLISGTVARVRLLPDGRRQIISFATPGDLIAVRAVLMERLPDNIETLSNCTMHLLDCGAAIELGARHPDIAFRFMWQMAEDERRLRNNNVMLGKGTAKQRVSTMIADILGRLAIVTGSRDQERVIALRQRDIADYLGLTLVHVNRTLRRLRDEGAIEVAVGAIALRDPAIIFEYAAPMLDLYELETPEFGARPRA
jgi:CRP-like cAMP-binding protein